eukprot:scaffold870_cov268-Pinguiococcus_pyrenoidosus.AAC.1
MERNKEKALAKATRSRRKTSENWWRRFTEAVELADPITKDPKANGRTMALFVQFLAGAVARGQGTSNTLMGYASDVAQGLAAESSVGFEVNWDEARAVLKGRDRTRFEAGEMRPTPPKPGITVHMLRFWFTTPSALTGLSIDEITLKAMMGVAFFGLLRRSEYCQPTPRTAFNPNVQLSTESWKIWDPVGREGTMTTALLRTAGEGWSLVMAPPASKADQFRKKWGCCPILFPFGDGPVNAASRVRAYELQLAERGLRSEGPQPFFVDLSGKWITAERFDKDVKEALRRYAVAHELENPDEGRYGLHSFRIGGCNALRATGASTDLIMRLGRWSSEGSVPGYERGVQQRMSSTIRAAEEVSREDGECVSRGALRGVLK